MDYGKALRVLRGRRGLKQKELAEAVQISTAHLSLIESGKRSPSTDVVEKLAAALDVPVYLFFLLASGEKELRGIPPEVAEQLSGQLLSLLLEEQGA